MAYRRKYNPHRIILRTVNGVDKSVLSDVAHAKIQMVCVHTKDYVMEKRVESSLYKYIYTMNKT